MTNSFKGGQQKKLVPTPQPDQKTSWPKWVTVPLLIALLIISAVPYAALFRRPHWLPVPVLALYQIARPLHLVNHYGLFAVMTTERPEIILEGSEDEENWRPYEFRYKPGDLKRRPVFVAPHQPRLDWQMWFAALGRLETNPWVLNLGIRLLQGSPEVLRLFEKNPFENSLPRYVRAIAYDYQFTSFEERKETGDWWKRGEPRLYMPSISLREKSE